jgi:hypothetical protein
MHSKDKSPTEDSQPSVALRGASEKHRTRVELSDVFSNGHCLLRIDGVFLGYLFLNLASHGVYLKYTNVGSAYL